MATTITPAPVRQPRSRERAALVVGIALLAWAAWSVTLRPTLAPTPVERFQAAATVWADTWQHRGDSPEAFAAWSSEGDAAAAAEMRAAASHLGGDERRRAEAILVAVQQVSDIDASTLRNGPARGSSALEAGELERPIVARVRSEAAALA